MRKLVLLLAILIPGANAQYNISTLAGTASGDGATATSVALASSSIALDPSGNVYILTFYTARLYKLNLNGTLTLVAGNGSQGFSGDNGPATSASLSFPNGLAIDGAGNIYVADTGNNRIRKVSNGTITTIAGNGSASFGGDNGPATAASLNTPIGVAIDSNANLYIADFSNNRIRKVSGGNITTVAGNGTAGFNGDGVATSSELNLPRRIDLDGAGNIYIADTGNQRIRKVSGGTMTTIAGTGTAGFGDGSIASALLNTPTGVGVDSAGANVFIADSGNNRIRRVNNGNVTTVVGTGTADFTGDGGVASSATIRHPRQALIDAAGNLFIADNDNNRVRKVATSGIITTIAGGGSSGDGGPAASALLGGPYGLTLDASGNIYIADTSNSRIRKISNGIITTIAGNGTNSYTGDGAAATSAGLYFPQTVVVDNAGAVYIADTQNNVIRKITNGVINTIAGTGIATFNGDGPALSTSLNLPLGLAVDNSGNVYIADTYNQRIRKLSGGNITTIAGTGSPGFSGDNGPAASAQLNFPQTVSLDNAGNLYIPDYQNGRIRKIAGGTITTVAGGGGSLGDGGPATSGSLFQPEGVLLDSSGDLFISDTFHQRIRMVSEGILSTIAGTGIGGFSGDNGPAASAQVNNPVQLALDSSGKIYFADANNSLIRVLTPVPPAPPASNCSYVVTPVAGPAFSFVNNSFLSFGFAGGNAAFSVATAPGCSWNAVTSSPFISITGSSSVSGSGQVAFAVAQNSSSSARSGAIVIAGQTFLISQSGATGSLVCVVNAGVPPIVRAEALADEAGDVIFACTGSLPPGGVKVDVQAFFSSNISSRSLSSTNNSSEALLLVNEPASPVVGTNTFPGLIVSANSVLFPQIPLTLTSGNTLILRLTNVRFNAAALGVSSGFNITQVTAFLVLNTASVPVVVNSPTQVIAFSTTGFISSKGAQTSGPDPTTQLGFPLSFKEGFASAFRPRLASGQDPSQPGTFYNSESGFVNSSVFGPIVGFADTGTRVLARFNNIPAGLRLFASATSTSASSSATFAQLIPSANASGAGGTIPPAPIPRFANSYIEIPISNGAASATWEVTSSDPFSLENLVVSVYFQAVGQPPTAAQLNQIGVVLSPAPLSTISTSSITAPLPRFLDTTVPQVPVTVKLTSQLKFNGAAPPGPPGHSASGFHRDSVTVGSNVTFTSVIQNLGTQTATNVVVHDNLPVTSLVYQSCTLDNGQPCQATGNDLKIALNADLAPGASRTISINAMVADAPDGTLAFNTISVTSDLPNTDLGTSTIAFVISKCITCVQLTVGTNPPGLPVTADGTTYAQTAVQPVTPGLTHALSVNPSPPPVNNRMFLFSGWSNGVTTPSQSVLVSAPATITANFVSPTLSISSSHTGNFALGQNGALYTLTVSNAPSTTATSGTVTVTETLPAGLTLVNMTGSGWTCVTNTCTRADVLNPGASYPVITAKVNVSQTAGTPLLNQGSVAGGGSATANFTDPTAIATPALTLTRTSMNIGVNTSAASSPQPVGVNFSNGGALNWSASSNQPNITVNPPSGTGNAIFQVSATQGSSGVVTVSAPGATGSPKTVQVNVTNAPSGAPFGSFDTPGNNSTGISGAVAVTGWALDNVEVTNVDIWREKIGNEPVSGNGLVFIGNSVFVSGARPDVQGQNPNAPFNDRAGWGYLMLTTGLPGTPPGNGTYKLHAIAHNKAGQSTDLGTKSITVDNSHSTKPFGTIDTPDQGGTISGTQFINFGWALAQNPNCIPTDGSTMTVTVDSVTLGHPTYNQARADLAAAFPGRCNSAGAAGYFFIDTTQLSNGVHTIGWVAYDDHGNGDGLGSRFLTVFNNGSTAQPEEPAPVASKREVTLRRGYSLDRASLPLAPSANGSYSIEIEELDRIELDAGITGGDQLPIGSSVKNGVFYWQLAPGFLGTYDIVFQRADGSDLRVSIVVQPAQYK